MESILSSLTLGGGMTSWGSLLMTTAAALLLYHWLSRPRNLPPGPRPWPVVGNMIGYGDLNQTLTAISRDYGPVASMWYGPRLVVVLGSHDVINEAFVKQSDVFSSRPRFLHNINQGIKRMGNGILWQNDEPWKLMRRLMLQTMRDFGVGKRSLEERIHEEVTVVSDRLEATKASPCIVKADLLNATTNIICSIVFGRRWDYSDPEFVKLNGLFTAIFALPLIRPASVFPFLQFFALVSKKFRQTSLLIRQLYAFLLQQMEEHEATFETEHPRDLVDVYLKAQKQGMQSSVLTTRNMQRGVMDVFVAGAETTATSLNWALLFMLVHPEVQKKCQDEIDKAVGQGRMVSMSDKKSLPYVRATISETMRLGNTLAISLPHCTTKETTIRGFTIPADTMVFANLRASHLDPDLWPDPMTFRPERFLDDQGQLIKNDAAMPFSAGPRICLGESLARMELFLFFSNLLQRFSFSKVEDEELTTDGIMGITNGPRPYHLVATKR